MKRATVLLAVVVAAVTAPVAIRAVRHARAPDFEPGVDLHYRTRAELEGMVLSRRTGAGILTVRAAKAAPAQRGLGHLALGPSLFLALEEVGAELAGPEGVVLSVRGERGEVREGHLHLTGRVRVTGRDGRERRVSEVRLDLDSGRASIR